jgi:hypothetical protein
MASYSHISDANNKVFRKNFGLPALRSGLKDGTITLSEKQQKKLQTCERNKNRILGDRRHVKKNVVQSKYGRNYYRFYRWGYCQKSRLRWRGEILMRCGKRLTRCTTNPPLIERYSPYSNS